SRAPARAAKGSGFPVFAGSVQTGVQTRGAPAVSSNMEASCDELSPEWGSGGRWFESSRPDMPRACDALTCVTGPFIMRCPTPLISPLGRPRHGPPTQAPQEKWLLDDQSRRHRNLLRQGRARSLRRRPPPFSGPPETLHRPPPSTESRPFLRSAL